MKALPLSLKTSTSCVGLHLLRLGQGLRNQELLLILANTSPHPVFSCYCIHPHPHCKTYLGSTIYILMVHFLAPLKGLAFNTKYMAKIFQCQDGGERVAWKWKHGCAHKYFKEMCIG